MSRNTSVIFARSSDPQRGVTERTLLIGFCVAVGLILLVAGMVLLNQAIWSNRVDAKIAKLAAAGQPVSIGDIKRRHQEGMPRVNAADIYEKAFAAMQAMTGFNKDLLPLVGHAALPEDGDPLPAEMAEEIGRFLEAHAEAVAYFLARSQIVECRFSPTFTPEGDVGVEYVVRIRAGARLLALETMLAVHERRPTDAATAVIAIFRISDHLRNDPFLVTALTRVAVAGIGFAYLPQVLDSEGLSEEALFSIQTAVAATEDELLLAPALPTEIAGGIDYSMTGRPGEPGKATDWEGFLSSGLMTAYRLAGQTDRDLIYYLERMEELVESAQKPLAQRAIPSWSHDAPAWRAHIKGVSFVDELLPRLDRMFEVEKKAVATARAGLLGVAASRFLLRYGHYPVDVSELVDVFLQPAQIIDPYTGAPLEYLLDEDGFTVTVEGEVILKVRGRGAPDRR